MTITYLLRLDIVDGILRSSAPTLDDDGEQGDDEAGRKHGDFIEVLSIDKTPLSLQSLLAVHFILLHNLINFKLLNLLFLVLLMNLRDLSSVSSQKHQYSSGR